MSRKGKGDRGGWWESDRQPLKAAVYWGEEEYIMQAVKVTGTVNSQGQLILDQPLDLLENSRVEVIILVENQEAELNVNDDTLEEEILADLRQAWHEAMTGQTVPVSQLWDDIDSE
ncbi:MAG: hypothetical protein VKK04_04780 [Synechococcales bacterium]|nr:hypothetical protein [Synechococcales bacterium]